MRAALYDLLEQVLHRAGIGRDDFQRTDQGDGVLVLLNPVVPKTRVLPGLILRLAAGLDRYNRTAPAPCRMRLRAALHAGEVASDVHGHASKDLNLTFRLLDSDRLRSDLARTQANLALLVSESIYNDIVRQGYRDLDAEAFQPVQVAAKGTYARAWLFLPGRHNRVPNGPGQAVPATVTSSVPREVPPDITDFTGREAELDRLLRLLDGPDQRSPTVVALHGVGGVGKSALAIHAAHRLAPSFPDGVLYVNLQGATVGLLPLDPGEVLGRLLRALGVDGRDIPINVEEASARLRSLLAGRRVLLVLDNAVSPAQVRPLLLFARERAGRDEPEIGRDAALRRMLDCYLATTHLANRLLQPFAAGGASWRIEASTQPLASRAEAFAWFESERANLLAAARQAAGGAGTLPQTATRLAEVMFWFFEMRTYWRDFEEVNQLAVQAARQRGDRHGEAVALNDLGWACLRLGRLEDAVRFFQRSRTISLELGDRRWVGLAEMHLGAAYHEQGRLDRAVELVEHARACLREAGDRFNESWALHRLGALHCDQERFDQAVNYLQQSLIIRREFEDRHGEAKTIGDIGEVHYRAGFHHGAIECYELSLRIHREMGDRRRQAEMLWRLGYALHALGRHGQARASWRESRKIFEELGVPFPRHRGLKGTLWS